MALEIRQNLKLSQQLIMTQKLQQAIKLLQLSRLELVGEINQVLESNPVLEEYQLEDKGPENQEADFLSPTWEGQEMAVPESPEINEEKAAATEMDWVRFLQDRLIPDTNGDYEDRETPSFENYKAQATTLKAHLMWQLRMARLDEQGDHIGTLIIGNLDSDGYLQATIEEIAAEVGCEPEQVEKVLAIIQGFDPTGVAARDLKECLLIQISALGPPDPLVCAIIEDHLPHLANKNFQAIAKELTVSLEEVFRACAVISQLNPKPGRIFDQEESPYINPDVYVQKVGDDFVIILNEDGLPKLRINSFYLDAMRNPNQLPESVKNYIQRHLDGALWFIRSINQRQKTLYKVTESIVRFQRDFLEHGLDNLKPLTLRQVAEDIGMHESTISRVTTNKYIHTPQGLYDLKYFFNSGLNLAMGDQIASESVKEKIRQIVQSEDPKHPLSDQEIAEILRKDNVIIARRTVAKYRGLLGVLSSSKRKKPPYHDREVVSA